jgi:hypothetical protein
MAGHQGSNWLNANWATLPSNEWVAADAGGLVGNDALLDRLLGRVLANAPPSRAQELAIAFCTKDVIQ